MISTKKGILYWTVQKGVTVSVVIIKNDGWDMYDEILMEFKQDKELSTYPIITLSVGDGLIVDGNNLLINLTYEQTASIEQCQLFSDIKLRSGSIVIPPIPFVVNIVETVTNI